MVEQVTGQRFSPRRALDFGCGVGRLMAPLGLRAESIVGVDISPAMLDLARARCAEVAVRDASFVLSDETLSRVEGQFDFVHSFIVFQHVPPRLGYRLLDAILARLEPGGAAALHFTYARRAPWVRKLVHRLRRGSQLVNMAVNVMQGVPLRFPMMPMYEYDRARLLATVHRIGAREVLQHETDHGGHLGVLLVFRRPTQ
jgi:SAM-dependent methyltransferase